MTTGPAVARVAKIRLQSVGTGAEITDAELEVMLWASEAVGLAAGEGPCSLAKPGNGENWIEKAHGHLPNYICHVAKAIKKSNPAYDTGRAIAAAISRIKKWIASPNTKPDTKAKATAAIAEWEKLRAKAKADNKK